MATVTAAEFRVSSRITASNAAGAGININKAFLDDSKNGAGTIVPNRVFLLDKEAITSGSSLTIDLYDLGSLDLGAGAGDDNLGETHANSFINSVMIQSDAASAGTLRINQSVTNAWTGITGGSATSIDLPAGGFYAISYGSDGYAVTDASDHILQIDAVTGDVTATVVFVSNQEIIMSFTFDVCKTGDDGYQVSGTTGKGSSRNATQTFTQTYLVKVMDASGSLISSNYSSVAAAQVGLASGLPIVQRTVYRDDDAGVFHPYALCMSKDVKRRREQPALFDVTCTFKTTSMETEFAGTDQVQEPTDISPEVIVSTGSSEKVLYGDYFGDQCFMWKHTREWFNRPVTRDFPLLTLTVTQYEKYISYQDILDRSYVTNLGNFKGYDTDHWRMIVKNVSEVVIPTSSGDQEWAKVTYEITKGANGYYKWRYAMGDNTYVEEGWKDIGWNVEVPAIASKYLDAVGGKVHRFADEDTSERYLGKIFPNTNVKMSDEEQESNLMLYKEFTPYDSIDFSEFLQDF